MICGLDGSTTIRDTPQNGGTNAQGGSPRDPVACHVAPPSMLLNTPVVPPAYQTVGPLESAASAAGSPEGRLLSACQETPPSVVIANCVPVLTLPLVTGKSKDDVAPA